MMNERQNTLRKQAYRLAFAAPSLSQAILSGGFRSVFKGRGMDFDSTREYEARDDALRIDWNATARFGRPFVKIYADDRDLVLYLIIDESPSMNFGSPRTKHETAALAASLLAYASAVQGIRIGAMFFGNGTDYTHIASGEHAARSLVERITTQPKNASASDLGKALQSAGRLLKRRALIVILSDFLTAGYSLPLALTARCHDIVALRVCDELDSKAPDHTFSLRSADAENHKPRFIVPFSGRYRAMRCHAAENARLEWLVSLSAARIPYLEINPETDPAAALIRFFAQRRLGHGS